MNRKVSVFLLAAAMAVGAYAQNLIENSGFENGVSEWAPPSWNRGPNDRVWLYPAQDKTVSQGVGGAASMKLAWEKKHICYIWYKKEIPLNGLKEVELSFWAKSVGYDDVNIVEISVNFPEIKDTKLKTVAVANHWNRSPKEWTQFSSRVKVPAGATKAKLCIKIHGFKSSKGTSWIDNVYFGPVQQKAGQSVKKK